MATPNFEQIQSFGNVTRQLVQAAVDEFMKLYSAELSFDETVELMALVAEQYGLLGSELGAQWYDLCTSLANIDADPADIQQMNADDLRVRAKWYLDNKVDQAQVFQYYLQNVINDSVRTTGGNNLWRDYTRGLVAGKWARVPVGDTCAWCLMLASQGAWYVSKKSALGAEPDHYHDGCNCIAVYHADPNDIPNYDNLVRYKKMYYDAENARIANEEGRTRYNDELRDRISSARKKHLERNEKLKAEGKEDKVREWTKYNETLIVMRYQNEGLH